MEVSFKLTERERKFSSSGKVTLILISLLYFLNTVLDVLKNVEVKTVIGPQRSVEEEFVIDLGDRAQVPIVSFSATSPSLSSRSPYFVRTAQNDSCQVKAITAIIQSFQWREVVPIFEDTEYGNGFIPYVIDALQEVDVKVKYRGIISVTATNDQILEELYKLMTMENKVFVVHMTPSLVTLFFLKVKEAGMMSEGHVWIVTAGTMNLLDSFHRDVIQAMQGVLGVKPFIPKSERLENFTARWKKETQLNLTPLASQTGLKLLNAILETRFSGLAGEFHLAVGQLQPSNFQFLSVIGKGEKVIGFWTPELGITRELNMNTSVRKYSTSRSAFRYIIWPGESTVIPKGWVIPVNGKKLRIGVPVNTGYTQLVNVVWDSQHNTTIVRGFCTDVFNAVKKRLPYAVPYEFIPFAKADGSTSSPTHFKLKLYQSDVYYLFLYHMDKPIYNFDAVVGDITILSNRSLYVDFTLPYTKGGVMMTIPIKYEEKEKNSSIFLKTLTTDLWLVILAFFVLIGLLVLFLEDQRKNEFRDSPSQQVRGKLSSNLTRAVVIVWMVIMLILTSCYTVNLSLILTVQRLKPSFTSIEALQKNGDYVGYQVGDFIFELLKQLNFDESKLIACDTSADYDEALSKGSLSEEISAYFEIPLAMKVFGATYCDKYTIIGPIHKTEGFSFNSTRVQLLVNGSDELVDSSPKPGLK
ncbi:glutamate receptor 2.6-like [Macadamia integrifolia]|uniref:glutamate receptor 2.6-like n=1 Tax=Macadamia integrifolia TaxID=60698 RepID=UPI001C527F6D|nr:glutamate receptor 2.6-like [Macadamia integrifolia]